MERTPSNLVKCFFPFGLLLALSHLHTLPDFVSVLTGLVEIVWIAAGGKEHRAFND